MKCRNMIGPQVRKLRYQRGWSQEKLAEQLQLVGWDIGRVAVSKIESRLVHIDDYELLYFANVFNVGLADLFPKIGAEQQIHEALMVLMQRRPPQKLLLGKIRL